MGESNSKIIAVALIALAIIALSIIYVIHPLSVVIKAISAIAVLVIFGMLIQKVMNLSGWYGIYMVGSKKGLKKIDEISKKHKVFWDVMAMWGLTMGFGLLAYPLTKGKIDKRVFAFGMVSLIVILFLVLPYISYGFQFINISQIQNAVSTQSQSGPSIISYIVYAATIIAGFSGSIMVSLFANTESILYSFILYLSKPSLGTVGSGISSQIPGVAPIIPGIDIPLAAGIISLAVLLMIHEFSHGVLARKAKVKLKSIGILVFGIIPIGGYVEPDEEMINKLDKANQTKIFSAGISANFIAMLVFFALMLLLLTFVIPTAYKYNVIITAVSPNYPANSVLKSGMDILKWNNYTIKNITSLTVASATDKPNGTVTVLTNTGFYTFKAVKDPTNSSKGLIGVSLGYAPSITTPYAKIVYFLFTVFALSMLLNFLVAVVNLLPLPGLDGWRIYYANIKNEKFIKFMGALIIALIIINVLPWIFYI
jgi:membrane-associated protease RseP (regulator of RpoE activity)